MWTVMQATGREQELGKTIEDMYEMYQGRMEKLNVEVWQGLCNYVDNEDFLVQGEIHRKKVFDRYRRKERFCSGSRL